MGGGCIRHARPLPRPAGSPSARGGRFKTRVGGPERRVGAALTRGGGEKRRVSAASARVGGSDRRAGGGQMGAGHGGASTLIRDHSCRFVVSTPLPPPRSLPRRPRPHSSFIIR